VVPPPGVVAGVVPSPGVVDGVVSGGVTMITGSKGFLVANTSNVAGGLVDRVAALVGVVEVSDEPAAGSVVNVDVVAFEPPPPLNTVNFKSAPTSSTPAIDNPMITRRRSPWLISSPAQSSRSHRSSYRSRAV